MKILLVIPYLSSVYGGTSKVVTELAESLADLGLQVDIVTTNANATSKLDVDIGIWTICKNYRIMYFSCYHRNDLIISFDLIKWLFRHVSSYKVVHLNTIFSPLILLSQWICQIQKICYLVTPHGMLEPWALSYKAGKKRLYYSLLEKPALQRASAIHVLNTSEAENIYSLGIENLVVVPNGIHSQEFEFLPEPEIFYKKFPNTKNKTIILFLGRIDPKKGLDLLAPAFSKVHEQFSNTHLVIAGPDSIGFLPTVKNYFTGVGCLDNVTFTGMLTGSLKYSALAAASLYVAPSYSEGFSMSVLEGMASGLPCVITTGCNFIEAGEAEAAYVVDINTDTIAEALIRCLSNPHAAKEMGTKARKLVFEQYTWKRIAETMLAIYTKIV